MRTESRTESEESEVAWIPEQGDLPYHQGRLKKEAQVNVMNKWTKGARVCVRAICSDV